MQETCRDLLDEYRELAALCATLSADDWRRPTAFYGWTPWDEIAHLCYFDQTALQSVTDPARFRADAQALAEVELYGGIVAIYKALGGGWQPQA